MREAGSRYFLAMARLATYFSLGGDEPQGHLAAAIYIVRIIKRAQNRLGGDFFQKRASLVVNGCHSTGFWFPSLSLDAVSGRRVSQTGGGDRGRGYM